MNKLKNIHIGNVGVRYLTEKPDTSYSDGMIENELLALFRSEGADKKISRILAANPPWEYLYHLSPQRAAVVDWYDFSKDASVLEIGAGCGAITEALVRKSVQVTALELTEKRSLINANRNKNADNLEILVGNLSDYKGGKDFDYIICVGVLEYAGRFINGEKRPYDRFIQLMRSRLKPTGRLLLAIENKLGLKYWAGAKEDHTGNYFDGQNQYPHGGAQTFGKHELTLLLQNNGFNGLDFYYPYPDYKHPRIIFSDDYYPGKGTEFPLNLLPTPVPGQSRVELFSEGLAMLALEKNNLFPHFSNSFIVVAKNG
jgi:SAM-dependent methyltransferase